MFEHSSRITVGVSGGPDSIALLDILQRLVTGTDESGSVESSNDRRALQIAHLDHMLRGRDSADDAEFVREVAATLGLPVTIAVVDVRAAAAASKRGVEDVAREIRYRFLRRVALETASDRIAVGHTMTDQAETVLMRLIRGAGMRGLAAMRSVGPVPVSDPGNLRAVSDYPNIFSTPAERAPAGALVPLLIRPLLCVTREEVEAYCRERGLAYRMDASNLSQDNTRSRIRNEVLPALCSINSQAVQAVARAADNAGFEDDALAGIAKAALARARFDPVGGEVGSYSVQALLEQPVGVRRRMIIEAIALARPVPAGETTSKHVKAVEGLLEAGSSGKRVQLPGRLEVWREYDSLIFRPAPCGSKDMILNQALGLNERAVEAGKVRLTLERGIPGCELRSVMAEARERRQSGARDWMVVALDDRLLPGELFIRGRMKGERAHVVGQRKTKKLKNLMIDHRIPSSRRADWPVVTTPDGGYIWSPGLPPSLRFTATDETESLAVLRASLI